MSLKESFINQHKKQSNFSETATSSPSLSVRSQPPLSSTNVKQETVKKKSGGGLLAALKKASQDQRNAVNSQKEGQSSPPDINAYKAKSKEPYLSKEGIFEHCCQAPDCQNLGIYGHSLKPLAIKDASAEWIEQAGFNQSFTFSKGEPLAQKHQWWKESILRAKTAKEYPISDSDITLQRSDGAGEWLCHDHLDTTEWGREIINSINASFDVGYENRRSDPLKPYKEINALTPPPEF